MNLVQILGVAAKLSAQLVAPLISIQSRLISRLFSGYYAGLIVLGHAPTSVPSLKFDLPQLKPISRCVTGALNGNIGVMKSMLGELTDASNMAQGFALLPIMWSLGGSLGYVDQ
ncbi:hypothetical protein ID866_1408 [Astraeus odoratus]|nr:hypothetical protein ID866_1408 [Astraeus odoratus]